MSNSNKEWIDDFDKFIAEMQEEIDRKDREDFSEHAIQIGHNPPKYGKIPIEEDPIIGFHRSSCGDGMTIYLKEKNNKITEWKFEVDGCVASTMAGAQLMLLIDECKGDLDKIKKITAKKILNALGQFPEENYHCAGLAMGALQAALKKINKH